MDVDKVLPLVYTIILDDKVVFADADVLNRNIGCCEGAARQQEEDWKRVKPLVEAAQIINTEIWWWLPVGHGEDRNLNDTQKGHLYRAYDACKALEAALAQLKVEGKE